MLIFFFFNPPTGGPLSALDYILLSVAGDRPSVCVISLPEEGGLIPPVRNDVTAARLQLPGSRCSFGPGKRTNRGQENRRQNASPFPSSQIWLRMHSPSVRGERVNLVNNGWW